MPDPLRLIRPTKNSCNVVFAPDQGTGVLIAREFLEYPGQPISSILSSAYICQFGTLPSDRMDFNL